MSQKTSQNELTEYIRRLGEHINLIYDKLKTLESRLDGLSQDVVNMKDTDYVKHQEFTDFLNQLTVSLKELVPPIPEITSEEAPSSEKDAESLD